MPKTFNLTGGPLLQKNYESKKKITINRGGTSSSKTQSLLRLFLNWLMIGSIDDEKYFTKGVLSIARKYRATLEKSVQRDWEEILDEYDVRDFISINKTSNTYQHKGRIVEFIGIDDPQKARGPRRKILYCNEANELNEEDFMQLILRTEYKTFIDFNPDDEDVWINTELEQKRAIQEGDVNIIVSNHWDNPFLDDSIHKEIERLKTKNPTKYRIYGLGEYGRLEGRIYENWKDIDRVPEEATRIGLGLDFGYTNDPTACVDVYKWNNAIILDELFYQTRLKNVYHSESERLNSIVGQLERFEIGPNVEIIADSSEPKSIEEIYLSGFNISAVTKGPDSIRFGIDLVSGYNVYVTARSTNVRKECRKYAWKTDKNGKTLPEPMDNDNHAMDAIRYLFMMKLKKHEEPVKTSLHFVI